MLRVLVTDGCVDAADSMALLVRCLGYQVRSAYTGRASLALAESFRPHVAINELLLPDIDGYQLGERLRGKVLLIAWTHHTDDVHRRRAAAAGYRLHFPKTGDPKGIEEALSHLAAMVRQQPEQAAFLNTCNR